MKRSKIYALTLSTVLALTGCAEDVPCSISEEHYHYYHTNDGLKRLMDGEKEYNGSFIRSEDYLLADDYYATIVDNKMYLLEANLDYVKERFQNRKPNYRLELVSEYVPEQYGLSYKDGKLTYGLIEGHEEYKWQPIEMDIYTSNPIKDVSYGILLYRLLPDGTLESKIFDSLDNIDDAYNLFKTGDIITEIEGEEYYLDNKSLNKSVDN